eukprot:195503-Pleurochrysis_carterae.AAC.1
MEKFVTDQKPATSNSAYQTARNNAARLNAALARPDTATHLRTENVDTDSGQNDGHADADSSLRPGLRPRSLQQQPTNLDGSQVCKMPHSSK